MDECGVTNSAAFEAGKGRKVVLFYVQSTMTVMSARGGEGRE